jgi:hypothetical protein
VPFRCLHYPCHRPGRLLRCKGTRRAARESSPKFTEMRRDTATSEQIGDKHSDKIAERSLHVRIDAGAHLYRIPRAIGLVEPDPWACKGEQPEAGNDCSCGCMAMWWYHSYSVALSFVKLGVLPPSNRLTAYPIKERLDAVYLYLQGNLPKTHIVTRTSLPPLYNPIFQRLQHIMESSCSLDLFSPW